MCCFFGIRAIINDAAAIYLAGRLGVVNRVRLTTYLFYPITIFLGTTQRSSELLSEDTFTFFIRLIGKGVTLEFEDEDEGILWCKKAGGDVKESYQEAYGLCSSTQEEGVS